jgi:hypothetical protein
MQHFKSLLLNDPGMRKLPARPAGSCLHRTASCLTVGIQRICTFCCALLMPQPLAACNLRYCCMQMCAHSAHDGNSTCICQLQVPCASDVLPSVAGRATLLCWNSRTQARLALASPSTPSATAPCDVAARPGIAAGSWTRPPAVRDWSSTSTPVVYLPFKVPIVRQPQHRCPTRRSDSWQPRTPVRYTCR